MVEVALSLLPVFGLIALGALLARVRLLPAEGWAAIERLNYWVLFPALLFESVVTADASGGETGRLALAVLLGNLVIAMAMLLARPLLRVSGASFSSLFQCAVRWNSYVALGIAASLFGDTGVAFAAIVVAVLVPVNNLMSVYVISRFAGSAPAPLGQTLRSVALNPLILSTVSGGVLLVAGLRPPGPLLEGLELLGQATIAIGLLCVGAAMDLGRLKGAGATVVGAAVVRLGIAPAAAWAGCLALGVSGVPMSVAVICLATPLATSAYILARQLGGDAVLAANLVTATTLISLVTLPLAIALAT